MSRTRQISIAASLALAGCAPTMAAVGVPAPGEPAAPPAPPARANPFFQASPLPYHAPPFDRIRDSDFQPALEEGMQRHLDEVSSIANQVSQPTFENTIVPLERSGELLRRVRDVFFALTSANTSDTLQAIETAVAPELAAHADEIYLNAPLFARVKSLYDRRTTLGLDAEQQTLVERYHRDFVRSGAELSDADQTRLRALNQEASKLTTDFSNRLLAATRNAAVVVDDRAELDGLTDGEIAAAAEAAKQRGLAGKWVLVLQNTTQQPPQASLKNRALRERLFRASTLRAERGDSTDTRAVIRRLAQLRAQRAALLGYPDHATYQLADQMARTPAAATGLLARLVPPATARARSESAKMQTLIDRQGGSFKLQPWDWQYYAEQVRRAEYELDESQIRPYFELDRVLRDGVFYAAGQLYGLTFRERKDLPVYHPDVRVFEVFEADGEPVGLFYVDLFKRDNKRGGAWMDSFVDQSRLMGTKPVIFNVANFQKPAPGEPALLSFDDVTTLFHEFGHALHGLLSNVRYPTLAGTSVPRDFVEFPSQFNEHWALEPTVLANYAHHYRTGAPMPAALVAKIEKARTFDQGFATTEYLAAALLDMGWHSLSPEAPEQDVGAFEAATLRHYQIAMSEVPPRYRTSYFNHIWGGGYAARYYAYLWSEVLDHDAFAWFQEHGGMTRANGQRFRDMILSRGGSQDADTLYRAFRGRDASVEPLLEHRGLAARKGE